MDRAEKQSEVAALTASFKGAQVALCTDYRGLTVSEITTLRRDLRTSGATGVVVKNTLAKISAREAFPKASEAELKKFLELFRGPTFMIVSDSDAVAPAKVVSNFIKTKKKLVVKGGWLEGKCLDEPSVESLAKMPGRAETMSRLLQVLLGPATNLVRLMQEPGGRVVRVLEARRKALEEKGA